MASHSKDGFEITGIDDIKKILGDIAPKHANNLNRSTIHAVAGRAAKLSKSEAPKDEGVLRKAIKTKRRKAKPDKAQSDVVVTRGGSAKANAWYWRFVQYGTREKGANPFFTRALKLLNSDIDKIVIEEFGKKLIKLMEKEAKKK